MSDAPNFRDVVGEGLPPAEQERLERVHEMLIAAGPPPELPPELAEPPDRSGNVTELEPTGLPRRRIGAALALAAAIALIAFVGGYIAGHSKGTPFESVRTVKLENREASAVVKFGPRDKNGNTTMLLRVAGLKSLTERDYYTLYMTKGGKPIVVCGSFNVRGPQSTTLRFPVAYDPADFDGLEIARWDHATHKAVPVVSAQIS